MDLNGLLQGYLYLLLLLKYLAERHCEVVTNVIFYIEH
jgi:hypothetical protein